MASLKASLPEMTLVSTFFCRLGRSELVESRWWLRRLGTYHVDIILEGGLLALIHLVAHVGCSMLGSEVEAVSVWSYSSPVLAKVSGETGGGERGGDGMRGNGGEELCFIICVQGGPRGQEGRPGWGRLHQTSSDSRGLQVPCHSAGRRAGELTLTSGHAGGGVRRQRWKGGPRSSRFRIRPLHPQGGRWAARS